MNAIIDLKAKICSLENELLNKQVEYLTRIQAGAMLNELKGIFSEIKELQGKIKSTKDLFSKQESLIN
jgi:hypothetical protein